MGGSMLDPNMFGCSGNYNSGCWSKRDAKIPLQRQNTLHVHDSNSMYNIHLNVALIVASTIKSSEKQHHQMTADELYL